MNFFSALIRLFIRVSRHCSQGCRQHRGMKSILLAKFFMCCTKGDVPFILTWTWTHHPSFEDSRNTFNKVLLNHLLRFSLRIFYGNFMEIQVSAFQSVTDTWEAENLPLAQTYSFHPSVTHSSIIRWRKWICSTCRMVSGDWNLIF